MPIQPSLFVSCLKEANISNFIGVPDSLLKSFIEYVACSPHGISHSTACNEGTAISLAAGHFLATSKPSLVYLQNSGLGNCVNPLISLMDKKVYSIPVLLLIGWRGEPGLKDEPQHVRQGEITEALLNLLGIPYFILDPTINDPSEVVKKAFSLMFAELKPVALLAKKNSFSSSSAPTIVSSTKLPVRKDVFEVLLDSLPNNALIVCSTGKMSRELMELRNSRNQDPSQDFLTVGSMGHASSIALGLAESLPDRLIVCIDGDGSALMHMGALASIGQGNSKNLLHILLNNGAHESVGGQPTAAPYITFSSLAKACGYANSLTVDRLHDLKNALSTYQLSSQTTFIEIKTSLSASDSLGRPTKSPLENRLSFMSLINS